MFLSGYSRRARKGCVEPAKADVGGYCPPAFRVTMTACPSNQTKADLEKLTQSSWLANPTSAG